MVGEQDLLHRTAPVAGPVEHVHQHVMAYVEAGVQRLRVAFDEFGEGFFAPVGVAPFGWFLLDQLLLFLRVVRGFLFGLDVLDNMSWRLGPHIADIVEALTSGTACDLLELTNLERAGAHTVVFAEL